MTRPLADVWPYGSTGDPGVLLFETCLQAWRMDLPHGAAVLELGCHESDFAATLKRARPDVTVVGIDVRATALDGPSFAGDVFIVGDASLPETWARAGGATARFDAVVALSSVEHFGLGWYGDSAFAAADLLALTFAGVYSMGGWLYYDVPWSEPLGYAQTAHWRRYTDATLPHVRAGIYVERARTWVVPGHEAALLPAAPDTHEGNPHPFHYCAVLAGVA